MTDAPILRPERPGEAAAVHELVEAAFGEPVIGELVDRLRASPDWIGGLSFVAEEGGRLVGHVLLPARCSTRRRGSSTSSCSAR